MACRNWLTDRASAQTLATSAHARARATYDTQVVIPQMIAQFDRARVRHAGPRERVGERRDARRLHAEERA